MCLPLADNTMYGEGGSGGVEYEPLTFTRGHVAADTLKRKSCLIAAAIGGVAF